MIIRDYNRLKEMAKEAGARYASLESSMIRTDEANAKEVADIWFIDDVIDDDEARERAIRFKEYPLTKSHVEGLYKEFAKAYIGTVRQRCAEIKRTWKKAQPHGEWTWDVKLKPLLN